MQLGEGFNRLLYNDCTASIEPLLAALGDRTAEGKRLKDVAIREIFYRALNGYDCDVWVRRFHNHPAVTPDRYFFGLMSLGEKCEKRHARWLLNAADMDDLQWALNRESYASADKLERFHEIIKQAMLTARPGGSRHSTWKENGAVEGVASTTKEPVDSDASEDDSDRSDVRSLGYSDICTEYHSDGCSLNSHVYNEREHQGEVLDNDD